MIRLTKQEQESVFITLGIFSVLFVLLFLLKHHPSKMPEEDPKPIEVMLEGGGGGGGATINFGESGGGAKFQSSQPTEEVVGSSDDKAEAVANTKPVPVRDHQMQNPKPQVDNIPKRPPNAAVDNLLSGSDQSGGNGNGLSSGSYGDGGTGNGTGGGDGTGNGTGSGPGSGSGSGGGSGSGRGTGVGNYTLAGRKALAKSEPVGCNETGTVTVKITVDRSGSVIKADTDRGTNASPCLMQQARAAAMKWKFDAGNADKQVGQIVYNFKHTE
ncbi:hypothetical protein CHU92_10845 [Flavobacterium cyanobacteriorum]|uniref:Uncharacterized protein n=1 Tax=Flavobacterium cyanobacteriorum TaxID=2022802 RepID=A0A255Z1W1_9FLAO|nr:energy transducer TonB [Flavobacterium cyanobacteriorum]OYQ35466.1 hypothetical protein CHU92_10845 [Flavobacterium cyanobacteriorum]